MWRGARPAGTETTKHKHISGANAEEQQKRYDGKWGENGGERIKKKESGRVRERESERGLGLILGLARCQIWVGGRGETG